jgi:hypothetical protein
VQKIVHKGALHEENAPKMCDTNVSNQLDIGANCASISFPLMSQESNI